MARKKQTYTLSIEFGDEEKLQDLSKEFGCLWGDSPSPSALIRAICKGEIKLYKAESIEEADARDLKNLKANLLEAQLKLAELAIAIETITNKDSE